MTQVYAGPFNLLRAQLQYFLRDKEKFGNFYLHDMIIYWVISTGPILL